jgi:hypothetical protein
MEDEKAAEQVAVAHAIKHGFDDCNIVSTTELGPGLSKVVVRGTFSWPTEELNPEDAAEVALFISTPFDLHFQIANGIIVDVEIAGMTFS